MRSTIVRFFLFVLFVCSSAFSGISQAVSITDIHFKELTLQDGLSDLTILDIAEDKDGYIWIATLSGLNRYSGYDIKQYTPSHDSEHSLPSDIINGLAKDATGNLWIATSEGLVRYRYETDDFEVTNKANSKLKSNNVSALSIANNGNLLFSDKYNIYELNHNTRNITSIIDISKYDIEVKSIFDDDNLLWIGSQKKGLYVYNYNSKKILSLNSGDAPWRLKDKIGTIYNISKFSHQYWVSTNDGVLVLKEKDYKTFPSTQGTHVYFTKQYKNIIVIGSENGLSFYNLDDDKMLSLGASNTEITGVTQNYLLSSFIDSTGKIWLGSYQGIFLHSEFENAFRLSENNKEFSENDSETTIWAISEDSNKNIWIATQSGGIANLGKELERKEYFLEDSSFTIWDFNIDKKNIFWLATSDGIKAYQFNGSGFSLLASYFDGRFIDSFYLEENKLWFIDNNQNRICEIKTSLIQRNSEEAESNIINCNLKLNTNKIFFTPIFYENNRLWLSEEKGLHIYDLNKGTFLKNFYGEEKKIKSSISKVYEWRNSYWVVSRLNVISQINKKSLKVKKQVMLGKNKTSSLSAEGDKNFLWVSTGNELYSFDLLNFEELDTISKPQLNNNFNERASLKSSTGMIVFGGTKGTNTFYPHKVEKKTGNKNKSRQPTIEDIKVFGDKTNNDLKDPLRKLRGSSLYLKSSESRFSIGFKLINPDFPELVEYRYKLENQDTAWVDTNGNLFAQLNSVPYGNYVFTVQAKEKGKTWSDSTSLSIEIERPPWLQTPALILYAVIASCITLFILRQYQVRKQNQLAIKESEERLKLTLWSSGDELWDWDVYRGQVFRSNTWGTLDFPQDNIRTTSAYDANIHPNDLLRVQQSLKAHLEGQSEFFEQAYRAKTFSNRWIWILDRGKVVSRDHNGQPVRMTGTLKNIHHLKEAEEQLNLFKRSIENISEGVFITNTNFKFISVNNAYCRYTGETREQALASYLFFHQYPEPFTEEIKKTLKVKGNWFGEVESVRVNGDKFEIELNIDAVHDEDGKISHFVGVFSDITSRKSTEKELLKLANTDPLTDLPNRSFFQASHANLVRRGENHALLCLDMDNFKKINDSLGHQTGDVLIKQIAKRIQRMTGKTATCYRLGGDEFSVLLEDKSDVHLITHFAQGLLDILARPFIINKQEFVLGASIGIAFYPDDGTTPQEMLKNADTAMYFAKNNGGNSYKFFSGEMNQNAVRQLQIENLIRQGIKDDLFSVYYQPKVDINSGRLVSMEALVRFEHPSKGIVSPGQFIPLAEQTGQIIDIGEQVLRKALTDTKRWVSQGIFSGRVAVNLSAKQFELPDLDDRITKILTEIGLSPLHLECELTEGTLMENPEEGLRMMERLREKGIHLALDDFGTGYSSLAYLKRFPLNTLKIDKAFIDDIAKSNVDRHMAAAIIQIAHNLGLKVVAEGVEEEEQLAILRRYDCEMLQGYLYSRPLSAERFEQLLLENQKLHQLINKHNSH